MEITVDSTPIIDNGTEQDSADDLRATVAGMSTEELADFKAGKTPPADETEDKAKEPPPDHQKIIDDQKAFIGRQSNEIGLMRAELAKLQKELISNKAAAPREQRKISEEDATKFFDDPIGKVQEEIDRRLAEKESESQAEKESYKQNYEAVVATLPEGVDIDSLMVEMFRVALEDGVPEEVVTEYAKNPWKENPRSTIALAKRAMAEIELRELRNPGKKPTPKKKHAVPFSSLTAASGEPSAPQTGAMTREQVANLSNEELAELKRRLNKTRR